MLMNFIDSLIGAFFKSLIIIICDVFDVVSNYVPVFSFSKSWARVLGDKPLRFNAFII